MKHLLYLFVSLLVSSGCSKKVDTEAIYDRLKAGEGQFIVSINGGLFYPDDSRFTGQIIATENSLRLNLFDQYKGNTILTLTKNNLFGEKPISQPIELDQQIQGSVMIGRVKDPVNQLGEGLLVTKGTVDVDQFTEDKLLIRMTGYVANFNTLRQTNTWKRFEGTLVYKKPKMTIQGIDKKKLIY